MDIDWAVTCRYAETDGMQATIIGAGADVAFVALFPQPVGIMLAIRLSGQIEELQSGEDHRLRVRILDPDRAPVRNADGSDGGPLEARFLAQNAHQLVDGWLVYPTFALGLQWLAASEGAYTIEVAVDDAEPKLTPFHVLPQDRQLT